MKQNLFKIKSKVNKIETTNDKLTGRGGILLFSRHLHNIGIYPILKHFFFSYSPDHSPGSIKLEFQ